MTATRDWAIVTGASSGIGRALAELLAQDGINLVMVARDGSTLAGEASVLEKYHGIKTIMYAGDLSKSDAVEGLVATVEEANIRVKYLINNAGVGLHGSLTDTQWSRERSMIDLNISALTYLSKVFAAQMAEQGEGRILNLSSLAAFFPTPRMSIYGATKAYVLHFSKSLRHELRDKGVSVTVLCPGPTDTKFAKTADVEQTASFNKKLPKPEVIAVYGYRSMMRGKPVVIYGIRNKLAVWGSRLVPRRLVAKFVERALKA